MLIKGPDFIDTLIIMLRVCAELICSVSTVLRETHAAIMDNTHQMENTKTISSV